MSCLLCNVLKCGYRHCTGTHIHARTHTHTYTHTQSKYKNSVVRCRNTPQSSTCTLSFSLFSYCSLSSLYLLLLFSRPHTKHKTPQYFLTFANLPLLLRVRMSLFSLIFFLSLSLILFPSLSLCLSLVLYLYLSLSLALCGGWVRLPSRPPAAPLPCWHLSTPLWWLAWPGRLTWMAWHRLKGVTCWAVLFSVLAFLSLSLTHTHSFSLSLTLAHSLTHTLPQTKGQCSHIKK